MQGILMVIILLFSFNLHEAIRLQSSFSPVIVMADYNKEYKHVINSDVVYMFLYNITNINLIDTVRINVESNASNDEPLIVFVHGNKEILSWQIPLVVKSRHFNNLMYNKTSRTLCPTKYKHKKQEDKEELITVTLSTANIQNILFKLNMTVENHFHLNLGENRSIEISPSQPVYYGYTFSKQIENSVIVHVKSDSDICMILSIQNISCPAFDLDDTIEFSGYWQTVNQQGGILVPREKYPLGFFIVLTVKSDDTDCYGVPVMNPLRVKHVILSVNTSITKQDYVIASGIVVLVIFSFCAIYIINIVVSKIKDREIKQLSHEQSEHIDAVIPSSSTVEEIVPCQSISIDEDSSLDEDDIDVMEDAFSDKEVIRTKRVLSVCDLARKDPKILRHKSRLYLYYLITITIFYTLPAIQLVFTYQYILDITGNGDRCYYNFLCAHPFGALSDVNHVFSNIGYIALGLLFIFLTYCREHNEFETEKNKCYGIPQHYGLFYAMGTALAMEGILSGCYHICPNQSNFQFDTSFMYIITVLCMIKIYQTRHPDINARASVTFGFLALIIFIVLIGEQNSSTYFWITFTIIYLLTCLYMTIQIYYMGRWKCKHLVVKVIQSYKHDIRSGIKNLLQPLYLGRFLMLVVANLCNVVLAMLANMFHIHNVPSFLLVILLSNLVLYTIFYILMKIFHKERILLRPLIYIILSFVFWSAALYFFLNKTISWEHTPAQSRTYNKPCNLLDFFDNHDIWHFLSALAMFFSFMVLLTLDDDLIDVHRSQIPVF